MCLGHETESQKNIEERAGKLKKMLVIAAQASQNTAGYPLPKLKGFVTIFNSFL